MLEIVGGIIFWVGFAGIAHTYVFYPLSLLLFAGRIPKPPEEPSEWPKISILVPAYNEELTIAAKIENCLALDYPVDKLEVMVGSDCSSDRTAEIVKENSDPRVRFFEMQQRSGKTGVLNHLIENVQGQILIFTDANAFFERDAVKKLIRHFENPDVGAVCGRLDVILPEGTNAVYGESVYRKFEIFLKTLESNFGGTTGAFGGFYALRRELFRPYSHDGSLDDVVTLLNAVEQKKRVIFEPEASSHEESSGSLREEFDRRVRIGKGNFQTLARMGYMIHPRFGATAYTFFSHKVLRWLSPFLLLSAFIGSLLLQSIAFYQTLLWFQIILYAAGLFAGFFSRLGIHIPVLIMIYHFTVLNVALLLGFFKWLQGERQVIWERSERKSS
ncbi:glycosyltransferase family 2 protein [bacterium]|nr:glycosyltransferase family 2 protein [bacterium]